MSKEKADRLPIGNGILRCCNQFPRRYANIEEMRRELPEIASLGFNAVWINPIQLTGRQPKRAKDPQGSLHGSLYAISDYWQIDPDFSVVERRSGGAPSHMTREEAFMMDKIAIRGYTDTARKEGLTPMFDLVLVHAAADSPLVTGESKRFKGKVDTSRWFKRNADGSVHVPGLTDGKSVSGGKIWDDVAQFNYDNPHIREEIFTHLWKPYIDMYMGELGFGGVRLDALANTPRR